MASITIRNLDDDIKLRLRIRAAKHGRSMEEEARAILRRAMDEAAPRAIWRRPSAPGSSLLAASILICLHVNPCQRRHISGAGENDRPRHQYHL